jgi:hypothetical protein
MYRAEGAASFFRGTTMRMLRIVPGGAIQVCVRACA